MSSSGGGSFAAILLSLPLTAVALMGVFGIPNLTQVIASPVKNADDGAGRSHRRDDDLEAPDWASDEWEDLDEDGEGESPPRRRSGGGDRLAAAGASGASRDDGFADLGERLSARRRARSLAPRDDEAPDDDRLASRSEDESIPERRGIDPFARTAQSDDSRRPLARPNDWSALSERPSSGRSFPEAIRDLSRLGVAHYHLEDGASSGSFLFVCLFSEGARSSVVHRFEAEAGDPTAAVDDVLNQIREWRSAQASLR